MWEAWLDKTHFFEQCWGVPKAKYKQNATGKLPLVDQIHRSDILNRGLYFGDEVEQWFDQPKRERCNGLCRGNYGMRLNTLLFWFAC